MAAIYTARSIANNEKSSPLFHLQGLSGYAASTITNLTIHGVPLERQIAYTTYASNISTFIAATDRRQTITITSRPLGHLQKHPLLPLIAPPVHFTLIKPLAADRADRFVTILGPGACRVQAGKQMIYQAPALSIETLRSVIQLSTPYFNAGRDSVNPRGLHAYNFLNHVICTFLTVHSYPAFLSENTGSQVLFEQLVGGPLGAPYYPKERTKTKDGTESRSALDISGKSLSVILDKLNNVDTDMESNLIEKAQESDGYISFKGNETVTKATPVTHKITSIGSWSSVPLSTGNVFPYFPGLIQPDHAFMSKMVLRHFFHLLGTTQEECQENYIELRRGLNSLATTSQGMVLCHILLGIDLALEVQARCFVIIEKSQYRGFCLLGARYAIFSNSKWSAAAEAEELRVQLARLDPHENAIHDMTEILSRLSTSEQYTGSVNRTIFSEPRLLADELQHLKLDDIGEDDMRELDRCVRNLNYMGTGYLTKNPQMVMEMLVTLNTQSSIELMTPTFLPSVRAPFSSDLFKVLSRFGPEAPSFWNDRGAEILCKAVEHSITTTGGKRKIGETDVYGNMPEKLLITPKPLLIAVKDLEKVIEKGKVKMDVNERAGKYRCVSIEHEGTKKGIWKELVALCAEPSKRQKTSEIETGRPAEVDLDELMTKLLG